MIDHTVLGCTCPGAFCRDCENILCYGKFSRNRRMKNGLQPACRACLKSYFGEWRAKKIGPVGQGLTNPDEKYCTQCKQFKCRNDFANNRAKKDGKASHCKTCVSSHGMSYRKRETVRARRQARYSNYYPTKTMRMVGMSRKDYVIVWTEQSGKCAICGNEETAKHQSGSLKRLAVDHDHVTGRFRGLLCTVCNQKLAVLEDIHFVSAAQAYLERSRSAILIEKIEPYPYS